MLTENQIREELKQVTVSGVKRTVDRMNLIRGVAITEEGAKITLASIGLNVVAQGRIEARIRKNLGKELGSDDLQIEYVETKAEDLNQIGRMVAVMSGEGGVGKSLISGLIAIALKRQGYEVGILDADITGPSIPKMFGLINRPDFTDNVLLLVLSRSGIEIMSINLLLPDEDEAVIWRGPLIGNTIKQFGNEVLWGKLDYLIIDLPPGTADFPLTVMQSFPVSGVIIVFTRQDLVEMIVKKAINMVRKMDKSVLGLVENMSYLYLPEIDSRIEVFGKSRGEEMSTAAGAPLIAQVPIDPELADLCDQGEIERYSNDLVTGLAESLDEIIQGKV